MRYDLIVIGCGPAGQKAALQAAKAGKRVAIVDERRLVGGACVHTATLPSKSLRESVYRWSLSSQGILGQEVRQTLRSLRTKRLPEMDRLMTRKERVVRSESRVVFDQLERNKIKMIRGRARILSPNEVGVEMSRKKYQRYSADFIVIAVGAHPITPDQFQSDGKYVFDSNSILGLKKTPKKMVVLGAGVIGCEYASIFSMAGTQVTLIDRRNEVLASIDREIVDQLVERFEYSGMKILLECDTRALKLKNVRNGVELALPGRRKIQADICLVALGRQGNTKDLGLEAVGIETDERGLIKVNENFQTRVPNIYAAGDVIGFPALASTSLEQGRIASGHAFQVPSEFGGNFPEHFPLGIYTIPEISIVGQTEEDLRRRGEPYVAGRARYKELARGQIVGDRWGLLKMLINPRDLKIHGIHIVGDNAAELVHIGQAVMSLGGDATYFIRNVFNYPTLAEAYKTAAFHAINQIHGTTSTR